MRRWRTILLGAAMTAGLMLGCSDISTPTRPVPYESRLFVFYDNNGTPAIDSLRFRWISAEQPVHYWVEDSLNAPAHVRNAISVWKGAFLYGEWDATLVSDSSQADVIVRVQQPPIKPGPAPLRMLGRRLECEGATDIDTVSTRRELRLPIRVYLNPRLPSDPDLDLCMRITAIHELGHSMGLFQHSADPLDIMFADPVATELSDRDISTIEALYHRKRDMVPVHTSTLD
jgi:predicted Zn-dependent protease